MTIADRFWSHVERGEGCWLWRGNRRSSGYGRFRVGTHSNSPKRPAHRVAFELAFGPIPDGLVICHRCDNPSCVRPSHLFLGSIQDNNADRHTKGRTSIGTAVGGAKLTPDTVDAIRAAYVKGSRELGGHALARRFGVTQMTILRAVRGETWQDR